MTDQEHIAKLEHEIRELKRTRGEAEAAAEVRGYQNGARDTRRDLRGLLRE